MSLPAGPTTNTAKVATKRKYYNEYHGDYTRLFLYSLTFYFILKRLKVS